MTDLAIPDEMQPVKQAEEFELGDKYIEFWDEYINALAVVEKYKARFKEIFGDHFTNPDESGVITYRGVKVGTFSPGKFADAQFARENPHLAKQYMRSKEVTYFDTASFRDTHPDMYNNYRSRTLRVNK